jgi:hypothetical protein
MAFTALPYTDLIWIPVFCSIHQHINSSIKRLMKIWVLYFCVTTCVVSNWLLQTVFKGIRAGLRTAEQVASLVIMQRLCHMLYGKQSHYKKALHNADSLCTLNELAVHQAGYCILKMQTCSPKCWWPLAIWHGINTQVHNLNECIHLFEKLWHYVMHGRNWQHIIICNYMQVPHWSGNSLLEAREKGKSIHRHRSYYGKLRTE